jgi:Ca2+-binding RTX toxin-like protein
MKRAVVLLVVVAAVLAMAGGVALALDKGCTAGDCVGTREADTLTGSTSVDRIVGMEGNDTITQPADFADNDEMYGDEGNDTITDNAAVGDNDKIWGDEGNDTINVREGNIFDDIVNCGPGKKDKVFFDQGNDIIANNCELKNPGQ